MGRSKLAVIMTRLFFLGCCLFLSQFSPVSGKKTDISISADNEFTMYAGAPGSSGTVLGKGNNYKKVYKFSGPSSGYLTVKVKDLHGFGRLILSTSDGAVTDSKWQCRLEGGVWKDAKEIAPNGVQIGNDKEFRKGIAPTANWIWVTSDGRPPSGVSFPYTVTCFTHIGKKTDISISADNEFTMYAGAPGSSGIVLGRGNNYKKVYQFSGPSSGNLTVKVKDLHGFGRLILSTSDGAVTDSKWQCRLEGGVWKDAKEIAPNGVQIGNDKEFRKGIAPTANWIWVTSDGRPPSGVSFPYTVTCFTHIGKKTDISI